MTKATPVFTVAIAGFGWWGKHIATRLAGHPWLRVVGIVEPVVENHAGILDLGLTAWTELAQPLAVPDIDAVILTTPNTLHEAQIAEIAKSGKHVFCEKPLGLTADSARRSVQACADAGVQLGIGHERRFEPAMLALRTALESGDLGTIMHAEAAFSHDKLINVPANDWRTRKAVSPAAGMTAMGIHLSDLLISFFGPIRTLHAFTADRSLGWETGDVVTVQMAFEAGMTATFSSVLHTPHFIRMHVFGTEKWIEVLNDSHPDTPDGIVRMLTAQTGKPVDQINYDWEDSVTANLEAFADAACGRAPYPFTTEEMVHNIQVLEAIALSAEIGQAVQLVDI
ncbi:1,5-anhydro-D-fructose reductase [Thalassovita gelatinovora]|uniref:1,5-anhydro-D-fructose reductase n=1 Tax=Thalassovita gelatinovora TaxID=53501 RepID=A0A0P1FJA8_THAGE|nr:Gfo/Idh/MocA family oxidoreductase [Thalassovita gelatinovora]QIZ81608.1 Gfo/Idh/MocA family oxidoreductase [Thalassovita gelatinovora]CUH68062.1 1,5-anhydro-D-fructose reductase [Thalassovita gelatinovora]SEQ28503.1 Predicted dehydrogenase [Thalassovita gelatinovora]